MAARSVWKGFVRFSLVSVPVKAYTATNSGGGRIALNQLHAGCNSRINYKKVCPQHGELTSDQIVSGYEFADGQYVVIDPAELDKLRPQSEKSIGIQAFIKPECFDAAYFNGKTYYLLPDGPVAAKPYALLRKVMQESGRHAFAQMVFHDREQVLLLRPCENLLAMTMLSYDAEVKKPSEFNDEAPKVEVTPDELKLAKTLIEAMTTDEFDFTQYADKYTDRLKELIEAKIQGRQIVAPQEEEAPQVINLMEALQKSLEAAKISGAAAKPPKLAAPSTAAKAATQKRARKKA